MAKAKSEPLFIGVGGHAVAIDAATGAELWRTKLKSNSIVTILAVGARVFAGAGGELFCLDPRNGGIFWHNKLKGLGLGLVAFGSNLEAAAACLAEQQQRQAATIPVVS